MITAYFNGKFLPKDEIKISPEDRGFMFADGIYEVVRWYKGFFYDMESHLSRMKRSMKELNIVWAEEDSFPTIAGDLININGLRQKHALVYIQITRGVAPRTHDFPSPAVTPTVYAHANSFMPNTSQIINGIGVLLKKEIRWSRCDIKSLALLPNTLNFHEAVENGFQECIFIRDGLITEGSHSNIFFVIDGTLFTHPESNNILSGVTRKNILRIAREAGITVEEVAVSESMIENINEAFVTNTGDEVTPVVKMGKYVVGNGHPGPLTISIWEKFQNETDTLKG